VITANRHLIGDEPVLLFLARVLRFLASDSEFSKKWPCQGL